MAVYTVRLQNVSGPDVVSLTDGTTYATLAVNPAVGPRGKGWTGVSYSTVTRKFTFTSNDGLGYVSDDISVGMEADTLDGQHGSYYTGYTDTAIANLIDTAPATLDTLNELAAALGDDPNFATTVTNSIATKANSSVTVSAGAGLTGGGDLTANRTISHADTSTQASVNNSGRTYIQDITLDDFGHITAIVSATDADDYVGTVTSVAATVPIGLTVSGSPITSAGTLAFSYTAGYQGYTTAEASKLAGIEAGATADMTAAEILTAIKTVDGSGSGLDADTLDGLNSTDFDPAGTALALAIALG